MFAMQTFFFFQPVVLNGTGADVQQFASSHDCLAPLQAHVVETQVVGLRVHRNSLANPLDPRTLLELHTAKESGLSTRLLMQAAIT